jgi:hypothetical protein
MDRSFANAGNGFLFRHWNGEISGCASDLIHFGVIAGGS